MIANQDNFQPNGRLRSIAFFSYDDQDAMAILRLLGPARQAGWEILRGYDFDDRMVHLEVVDKADLVLIQRDFCRDYETYTKIISLAKAQKKPLVVDLDDNLFELPANHPDRLTGYYAGSLLPLLLGIMDADLVTVPTKPLRDYLLRYNPNIRVIPNYLDDSLWKISTPKRLNDNHEKIVIGYMAGPSHRPDLQMVLPALLKIVGKYPGQIHFNFWGIDAPIELEAYSRVDWYPTETFRYDAFITAFQEMHADFMIAPLCDNLFNSCKSPIKFLEYGAIGVPGIYSRVPPYVNMINHGKDGFLAYTIEEWVENLCKLIEDPDLRLIMAENAQRKIKQRWLLSKNMNLRMQIYEDAVSNYILKDEITTPFYKIIKSFSEQYYEEQQRTENKIQSLQMELSNKEALVDELEHEILGYVNSQSWRFTRPMRVLKKNLRRIRNVQEN
ncbi:MAG: glycosyltransferase family 4 protein [Acidobacteriaceae bacterium]